MVKRLVGKSEIYQCEKCGHTYPTMEKAVQCESNPATPFQYAIGDTVVYKLESVIMHAGAWHDGTTGRAKVEDRWIGGLSEKNAPAHMNMYKLRTDRGLMACRPENKIFARV